MCIAHRFVSVDGTRVLFREAGDPAAPAVLLLHGFPTSSHMFRALIPELAGQYHVVAPDLPGFGFSDAPRRDAFVYTFDHLAQVIERFTESIGLARYTLYVFDYGAPIGFRLALAHPERIAALISQNGNAYTQGLSEGWNPIQRYWQQPTPSNRAALREFLHAEATRWQYTHGVTEPERVAPETFTLDQHFLDRPGLDEIQLDLFLDYRTNVALYPRFQDYLRTHLPPTLAVWGENDPFFVPAGAHAFRRDVPAAEVQFIPSGHFPLETHAAQVARLIRAFLARALAPAVPQDGPSAPPAAAQDSLDQMQKLFGCVPNLAVAMAAEPAALERHSSTRARGTDRRPRPGPSQRCRALSRRWLRPGRPRGGDAWRGDRELRDRRCTPHPACDRQRLPTAHNDQCSELIDLTRRQGPKMRSDILPGARS